MHPSATGLLELLHTCHQQLQFPSPKSVAAQSVPLVPHGAFCLLLKMCRAAEVSNCEVGICFPHLTRFFLMNTLVQKSYKQCPNCVLGMRTDSSETYKPNSRRCETRIANGPNGLCGCIMLTFGRKKFVSDILKRPRVPESSRLAFVYFLF